MMEVQLERQDWGACMQIMHLSSFLTRAKPYLGTQLANSGASRVLLGRGVAAPVVAACIAGSHDSCAVQCSGVVLLGVVLESSGAD